jgi:rubredoxin
MIKQCTCKHAMQDEMHGAGMRVHNPMKKVKDMPQEWRCTVCGKVKK